MKKFSHWAAALLLLATINSQLSTIFAQGTAFTYQGRLNLNGSPANGLYDFNFNLSSNPQGTIITASTGAPGVPVTNGLFITAIDFGPSQFVGTSNWLQIAVRTNGVGTYTNLSPLTLITPTPSAIFANTASNLIGTLPAGHLSGTLGNGQLANSSVTVSAGTGLSGGGTVPLGGSITLSNAGVLSVTGNADITAVTAGGAVTLSDTATNAGLPNTLVKRDGSDSFTAATITLLNDLVLEMPATINTSNGTIMYASSTTGNGGEFDTYLGWEAGNSYALPVSGNDNTAMGYEALNNNTNNGNTAIGSQAMEVNTSGIGNSAVGAEAMFWNTSGAQNTAIGNGALFNSTTGSYNTGEGENALYNNKIGNNNVAIGYDALFSGTTVSNNTAVGYQALYYNITNYNTAFGYQSLYSNTVAEFNTAVGHNALRNNSTNGFYNTAIGYDALEYNNAYFNTAVGIEALQLNMTGYRNTALGAGTLEANTIGGDNTAVGSSALAGSQGGFYNVAVGDTALESLGNGINNIAIGESAGGNLYESESNNIDIGNMGVAGENNITRIGTPGVQTNAFIAGTIFGDGGGLTNLSASALPSDVALLDGNQAFTGGNTFFNAVAVNASQTGGYGSPLFLAQNGNTIGLTAPAIRAVGYGDSANGVLSVSSQGTGLIAQFGNASSFVADITTNGTFEGAGFSGGTLRVGTNGTPFIAVQAGQAIMPSSSTVETNFTVAFPQAFSSPPKVIASISGDPSFPVATDTFAMSIRAITTTTNFTVNVVRVDTSGGWSQQLRINWQAWQ